jgi:hypothetical protein
MSIGKKRSEEIRKVLARIERLFVQHSETGNDDLQEMYDEIQLLRDHLWAVVDCDTAVIMDEEDGLDPARGSGSPLAAYKV